MAEELPRATAVFASDGSLEEVDWEAVTRVAQTKLRMMPEEDVPRVGATDFARRLAISQLYAHQWDLVHRARLMLAARHAGYLEGQSNPDAPDPFPPVPSEDPW